MPTTPRRSEGLLKAVKTCVLLDGMREQAEKRGFTPLIFYLDKTHLTMGGSKCMRYKRTRLSFSFLGWNKMRQALFWRWPRSLKHEKGLLWKKIRAAQIGRTCFCNIFGATILPEAGISSSLCERLTSKHTV